MIWYCEFSREFHVADNIVRLYLESQLTHMFTFLSRSIPFVPQIVSSVSLDKRMISIVPPKGLLDLSYRREEKVRIKGLLPPARES